MCWGKCFWFLPLLLTMKRKLVCPWFSLQCCSEFCCQFKLLRCWQIMWQPGCRFLCVYEEYQIGQNENSIVYLLKKMSCSISKHVCYIDVFQMEISRYAFVMWLFWMSQKKFGVNQNTVMFKNISAWSECVNVCFVCCA